MFKNCSQCKTHLSLKSFHRLKKGYLGRHSICKSCRKHNRSLNKVRNIDKEQYLKCLNCGINKSCQEFYINRSVSSGYQTYCKECQKHKIANSMSKLHIYSKTILKKMQKKYHNLNLNWKINPEDIIRKYREQDGKCYISKHSLTHQVDLKQRTDNIWNISLLIDLDKSEVTYSNFHLVIHLIYTMKELYKMDNDTILSMYKELI